VVEAEETPDPGVPYETQENIDAEQTELQQTQAATPGRDTPQAEVPGKLTICFLCSKYVRNLVLALKQLYVPVLRNRCILFFSSSQM